MRLDFDFHDPKTIGTLVGAGLVLSGAYWLIWKRSPRLANGLVFIAMVVLLCQLVNFDYILNEYFRVRWKLP